MFDDLDVRVDLGEALAGACEFWGVGSISIVKNLAVEIGEIDLIGVDEATGVVSVELKGACVTCPASTQTLKAGIERIMKERVDGVTEVVEINAVGMSESSVQL